MKKNKLVLISAAVMLSAFVGYGSACFDLNPCGGGKGATCIPLPSSVTLNTPIGKTDPLGYVPLIGQQCGIVINTLAPCGGPPVEASCN
jgi:hypothetical protein